MGVDRDIIVIGGGAAGLTAAQYAARANLRVSIVEELAQGGQALVIDRIENYPGFDTPISGSNSLRSSRHRQGTSGRIHTNHSTALKKEGDIFTVTTQQGDLTAYALIIATGQTSAPRYPRRKRVYRTRCVLLCTCDGPFFKGKKISLSGVETQPVMMQYSFETLFFDCSDPQEGTLQSTGSIAERVLKNPNIEVRFSTVARAIQGDTQVRKVMLENLKTRETL
jgi:thioredoxin reductase (NADPH)